MTHEQGPFALCADFLRWLCILIVCLSMQSCASPASNLDQLASHQGFERSMIDAGEFNLLVYRNTVPLESDSRHVSPAAAARLHVYLEGDGSPWLYRFINMPDPTPRHPLMLRLMEQDTHAAAYLGRPCYNGTASEPPCELPLWTSGRYSPAVIDSMAKGLRVLLKRHGVDELWLFGHSGGGALALLLAEQVSQVTRVVTLAGNLDTDAWTSHHGYTPLYSSLNPATRPPLRREVWQWHFLGGRDSVIPPQLIRPYVMRQSNASGFLFERFRHGCCWLSVWPRLLEALDNDDPRRVPAVQFKFRDALLDAGDSQ